MTEPPKRTNAQPSLHGREAALQAVVDVLHGRGFVQESLGRLRQQRHLRGREASLARQIALGAVRHALTIDHVLSAVARYDPRRVRTPLRAILLTAAYQILWMDRIPVFAAVNEAVEQARRHVGRRAPGMVNAVLRRLSGAIRVRRDTWRPRATHQVRTGFDRACTFETDVMPDAQRDGLAAYLAAAASERPERIAVLMARHGEEGAESIAWAAQAVPVTVVHRHLLRLSPGVFQTRLREAFGAAAEWSPDSAYLPAMVNVVDTALFREGRIYIQDVTAREAALLLDARRGESLLDFCAAPGGKAIVLAMQMDDRGEVVACDASPDRILRVRDNARRLRLTSIRTHLIQTSDASESDLARLFDGALVDVPCSNSGVIARRPEARLGLTPEKLASLTALQGALLRRAAASVRPGGRLVYSTCSIEPEENEQVVEAFLAEHPSWKVETARTTLPRWGAQLSDWRDGGYAALLRRGG